MVVLFVSTIPEHFGNLTKDISSDREHMMAFIYDSEAVPAFFFGAVIVAFDLSPMVLTTARLDRMNSFFHAIWAWKFMVMTDNDWYNRAWIMAQRQCATLLCGNTQLSISLEFAVSAVGLVRFAVEQVADGDSPWDFQSTGFHYEVTSFCILAAVTLFCNQSRWAEAKARVEQRRSDNTSNLVVGLLSTMCEVVVKLDAELCLLEPCPRLASMLLRQGPLAAGVCFCDLTSADDAERLRRCIQSLRDDTAAACASPAPALHMDLNDGSNEKFPAEVFISCVFDEDDRPVYLIGIQEDRERPPPPAPCDDLAVPPRGGSTDQPQLPALPEFSRLDGESSASEAASSLLVSESSETGDDEDGTALLWIDASRRSLPVLGHSRSFVLLGGPLGPCAALQDWMSADERRDFRDWLLDAVEPLDAPVFEHTVRLTPPRVHGRYKARCRLLEDDLDGSPAVPPGAKAACVQLTLLSFIPNRPKRHKHNSEAGRRRLKRLAGDGAAPASGDEAGGGQARQASGRGGARQAEGKAPPPGDAGAPQLDPAASG